MERAMMKIDCRICKEQIKEKENNYYISILITNVNTLNIY